METKTRVCRHARPGTWVLDALSSKKTGHFSQKDTQCPQELQNKSLRYTLFDPLHTSSASPWPLDCRDLKFRQSRLTCHPEETRTSCGTYPQGYSKRIDRPILTHLSSTTAYSFVINCMRLGSLFANGLSTSFEQRTESSGPATTPASQCESIKHWKKLAGLWLSPARDKTAVRVHMPL